MGATLDQARAAARRAKATLAGRSEVNGIGVTRHDDGYAVKVNLSAPCDAVPAAIDGVPVKSEIVGPIRKRT